MDLSCIISSGDLELYVLGLLPENDAYKIEQLALLFPEVKEELDRISESLEGLSVQASATPAASVKDRLMQKLHTLKEEEQQQPRMLSFDTTANRSAAIDDDTDSATPVIALPKRGGARRWLLAASVTGLVLSLGAAVYLASLNNTTRSEMAVLQKRVDTLHNQLSAQEQEMLAYSKTIELMRSENYKKISLANLPDKPEAQAQVFWNPQSGEVYFAAAVLPQPPANKQYQLWAIVDGKPVDAGLIEDERSAAQKMKAFTKADAFAISIENKGGSPVPTEVYMMGKV